MNGGDDSPKPRIEVYVRSLRPRGDHTQRRALDRLDELTAEGAIDGYEVVVWGDRVPPTPDGLRTRAGRFVLDRVVVFQRWAEENGAAIDDAFDVRSVDSAITGDRYDELVLPRMVVAAVADDQLLGIAPATVGGTHYSVPNFVDRLGDDESVFEATPVELNPLDGGDRDRETERPGGREPTTERLDHTVTALGGRSVGRDRDDGPAGDRTDEPTKHGRDGGDELGGDPSSTPYPPY